MILDVKFYIKKVDFSTLNIIYIKYTYWCQENNVKPYGSIQFGQQLTKHFNMNTKVKHIEGKSQRIYVE